MSRFVAEVIIFSVMVICITVSAIYFQSVGILWWYILPCVIGINWSDTE